MAFNDLLARVGNAQADYILQQIAQQQLAKQGPNWAQLQPQAGMLQQLFGPPDMESQLRGTPYDTSPQGVNPMVDSISQTRPDQSLAVDVTNGRSAGLMSPTAGAVGGTAAGMVLPFFAGKPAMGSSMPPVAPPPGGLPPPAAIPAAPALPSALPAAPAVPMAPPAAIPAAPAAPAVPMAPPAAPAGPMAMEMPQVQSWRFQQPAVPSVPPAAMDMAALGQFGNLPQPSPMNMEALSQFGRSAMPAAPAAPAAPWQPASDEALRALREVMGPPLRPAVTTNPILSKLGAAGRTARGAGRFLGRWAGPLALPLAAWSGSEQLRSTGEDAFGDSPAVAGPLATLSEAAAGGSVDPQMKQALQQWSDAVVRDRFFTPSSPDKLMEGEPSRGLINSLFRSPPQGIGNNAPQGVPSPAAVVAQNLGPEGLAPSLPTTAWRQPYQPPLQIGDRDALMSGLQQLAGSGARLRAQQGNPLLAALAGASGGGGGGASGMGSQLGQAMLAQALGLPANSLNRGNEEALRLLEIQNQMYRQGIQDARYNKEEARNAAHDLFNMGGGKVSMENIENAVKEFEKKRAELAAQFPNADPAKIAAQTFESLDSVSRRFLRKGEEQRLDFMPQLPPPRRTQVGAEEVETPRLRTLATQMITMPPADAAALIGDTDEEVGKLAALSDSALREFLATAQQDPKAFADGLRATRGFWRNPIDEIGANIKTPAPISGANARVRALADRIEKLGGR